MHQRLICLHGHFYQPPRENPWIEAVEVQDSAAPFHDWNARITAECYGPNGAARLKDGRGRIVDIFNNYLALSFNFGATLLAWMERHAPAAYQRILEADARSLRERGHGNAIAQGYNHAILPLCSPRDRQTQIRWGIADFRRRFRRDPEGIWLPETGADLATLQAVADEGMRFTVLSPYQATRVRPPGGAWANAVGAQFDPTRPYKVKLPRGGELVVFFYDGPIARSLAFGEGLASGEDLERRLEAGLDAARGHDELLTVAVDGETFGHHKKGGDEVLAAALRKISARTDLRIVNLGEALELIPAEWEAEIAEGSSWSCAHGIERWRSDCGCQGNGQPGWRQHWRAPLRDALDGLRDQLSTLFEREGGRLLRDPWRAREEFIELILDPDRAGAEAFLQRHAARKLPERERIAALKLLEMQRQAMLMYTSCGWFFSELSGLETVQILKYAARALQLAREATGVDLEPQFKAMLEKAPSNLPDLANGARIYDLQVKPSVVTLEGVAAHHAISSLVEGFPGGRERLFCYDLKVHGRRSEDAGAAALAVSQVSVRSVITHETVDLTTCVLHFSGADFRCGMRPYNDAAHAEIEQRLFSNLARHSLAQVLRTIDRDFPGRDYTLRDLFLDERREVTGMLLTDTMRRYENDYVQVFEVNRRLIDFLRELNSPVPRPLQVASDVALTQQAVQVAEALAEGKLSVELARADLAGLVQVTHRLGARIDPSQLLPRFNTALRRLLSRALDGRNDAAEELVELVALAGTHRLHLDLWQAQNSLWEQVRSGHCTLEADTLARLAEAFWLDAGAVSTPPPPRRGSPSTGTVAAPA